MKVDFINYQKDFYGELIPKEKFDKFKNLAIDKINRITNNRFSLLNIDEKYIKTICSVAEILYTNSFISEKIVSKISSSNNIVSENVDGFSRTYEQTDINKLQSQKKSEEEINIEIIKIIDLYLYDTNILYSGLNVF